MRTIALNGRWTGKAADAGTSLTVKPGQAMSSADLRRRLRGRSLFDTDTT